MLPNQTRCDGASQPTAQPKRSCRLASLQHRAMSSPTSSAAGGLRERCRQPASSSGGAGATRSISSHDPLTYFNHCRTHSRQCTLCCKRAWAPGDAQSGCKRAPTLEAPISGHIPPAACEMGEASSSAGAMAQTCLDALPEPLQEAIWQQLGLQDLAMAAAVCKAWAALTTVGRGRPLKPLGLNFQARN